METSTCKKIFDTLLVAAFLLLVFLPLGGSILIKDNTWSDAEKRLLHVMPSAPKSIAEIFSFPAHFEEYYRDHFGFRELMIFRYHREMEKRFGITGNPSVLKGQGQWLYYSIGDMLDDFQGRISISSETYHRWREDRLQRYRWLKGQGIEYLLFSPPNKQTVYPEFLPQDYIATRGVSRMAQLHSLLQRDPLPFYINVHDALLKAKSKQKLYFTTDTHWNYYGAYFCFREVMKKLGEIFPGQKFNVKIPFRRKPQPGPGGDLAKMLMIDRKVIEWYPVLRRRKNCSRQAPIDFPLSHIKDGIHVKPLLKKCEKARLKAVVFCDSFIESMEPFLSENFSQVLYLRKEYDQKNIEEVLHQFHPDIVIEEVIERDFFK